MNVARLKTLVDRLRADEQELQLQQKLQEAYNAFSNVVQQPGEAKHQTSFANKLTALAKALADAADRYTPQEHGLLEEIGALEYFTPTPVESIRVEIAENALTPAVVQKTLDRFRDRREKYVQALTSLSHSLSALHVTSELLEPGDAEIGFQFPRPLFKNSLDGLIVELRAIRRILRAFSELRTGSVPPFEVRQISTTDPIFFFGIDPYTAVAVGWAVSWALNQWKKVEEIRHLRAQTAKLPNFTEKEVEKFFGDKIRSQINSAIKDQTEALVATSKATKERKNEQQKDIHDTLTSLYGRIERGMTVEIRFLPPPKEDASEEEQTEEAKAFSELSQISPTLIFPEPDPSPIISLPHVDGDDEGPDSVSTM